MCGPPASGKTKRANEIATYLSINHKQKVCLINEESLGL